MPEQGSSSNAGSPMRSAGIVAFVSAVVRKNTDGDGNSKIEYHNNSPVRGIPANLPPVVATAVGDSTSQDSPSTATTINDERSASDAEIGLESNEKRGTFFHRQAPHVGRPPPEKIDENDSAASALSLEKGQNSASTISAQEEKKDSADQPDPSSSSKVPAKITVDASEQVGKTLDSPPPGPIMAHLMEGTAVEQSNSGSTSPTTSGLVTETEDLELEMKLQEMESQAPPPLLFPSEPELIAPPPVSSPSPALDIDAILDDSVPSTPSISSDDEAKGDVVVGYYKEGKRSIDDDRSFGSENVGATFASSLPRDGIVEPMVEPSVMPQEGETLAKIEKEAQSSMETGPVSPSANSAEIEREPPVATESAKNEESPVLADVPASVEIESPTVQEPKNGVAQLEESPDDKISAPIPLTIVQPSSAVSEQTIPSEGDAVEKENGQGTTDSPVEKEPTRVDASPTSAHEPEESQVKSKIGSPAVLLVPSATPEHAQGADVKVPNAEEPVSEARLKTPEVVVASTTEPTVNTLVVVGLDAAEEEEVLVHSEQQDGIQPPLASLPRTEDGPRTAAVDTEPPASEESGAVKLPVTVLVNGPEATKASTESVTEVSIAEKGDIVFPGAAQETATLDPTAVSSSSNHDDQDVTFVAQDNRGDLDVPYASNFEEGYFDSTFGQDVEANKGPPASPTKLAVPYASNFEEGYFDSTFDQDRQASKGPPANPTKLAVPRASNFEESKVEESFEIHDAKQRDDDKDLQEHAALIATPGVKVHSGGSIGSGGSGGGGVDAPSHRSRKSTAGNPSLVAARGNKTVGGRMMMITSPLLKSDASRGGSDAGTDEFDKDNDNEFSDDELKSTLAECSFSFVVAAPYLSSPFATAFFVFALKTTIYALIGTNLLRPDPTNPLGFPASVTFPVIVSQFFALLITVTTQDDLVDALNMIYEGYDREEFESAFPASSFLKWGLDVTGLLVDGVLGLAVTFLLVVTSTDVVELLLNFTAVEFVSLLDNGAFLLAKLGFMGKANKRMADIVTNTDYRVARKQNQSPTWQMWMLIFMYLLLVAGWVFIYALQIRGLYTTGGVVVQFDDELDIALATHSGKYTLHNVRGRFGFDRIRYWADNGPGMFGYCKSEEVWTFSESRNADPCRGYIARSSPSVDFDITTTNQDDWFATEDRSTLRFFPMANYQVLKGCVRHQDCGGLGQGTCRRNRCTCAPGFYGWRCDHSKNDTCGAIEADDVLTTPFTGSQSYFQRYDLLTFDNGDLVLVYDRPVYLSRITSLGAGDVIFYFGLRWGLFPLPYNLGSLVNLTDRSELANYFSSNLDLRLFLNSSEFFVSEAVIFNTPTDGPTPTGLGWQRVRRDKNVFSSTGADTVMICAICGPKNPCANDNECPASGRCNCTNGATGTLCRRTPLSNGFCDTGYFNAFQFNFDGGDCCERTCINEGNNTCGVLAINDAEFVRVGFPQCRETDLLCSPISDNSQCWNAKSRDFQSISANVGSSLAVSANGRIIVEAAPFIERVRVLDQVDSRWIRRGGNIEDVRGSRFGSVVAMYTPPPEATSNSTNGVHVVLAVGLYRLDMAVLRVVYWDEITEDWTSAGGDINLSDRASIITSVKVGRSGEKLTVVVGLDDGSLLCLVGTENGSTSWTRIGTLMGETFALSGNGRTLAVVPQNSSTTVDIYNVGLTNTTVSIEFVRSGRLDDGSTTGSILSMTLSYHGQFLTAVLLSDNGQNDQALQLDVTSPFPSSRDVRDSIGPLSRSTLNAGFVPLSLNEAGSSFAITVDKRQGLTLEVYHYFQALRRFVQVGEDYNNVFFDSTFGVSEEGSMLAVGRQGTVQVFRLYPSCGQGDSSYRLSLNLGLSTSTVSWRLKSFRMVGNNTVFTERVNETCIECYSSAAALANVNYEGCRDERDCLLLEYLDGSGNGTTYFQLFDNETMALRDVAMMEPTISRTGNSLGCQLERKSCQVGESLATVALSYDYFIEDTYWYVRDESGRMLADSRNSTPSGFESTEFSQICVPQGSGCLSFTIEDNSADGTCCDYGEGRYTLFHNDAEVVKRNGDQFAFGERVNFGSCPTKVTAADRVTVMFQLNAGADALVWYLEDENRKRLGSWSSAPTLEATNIATNADFFLEDTVGCLFFVVEDDGRDGFLGNGTGYTVMFNGETVVQRDGKFGFAERTSFGKPNCPVETIRSELVTAVVQVDASPQDTSWYIGNSSGVVIERGVVSSQNGTESTMSFDPIAVDDPDRCFTFSIMDRIGDGGGPYQLRVGWESPIAREGNYGYGERVRLGSGCQVEVFSGFQTTLSLTLDDAPNETSWYVSTLDGAVLSAQPSLANSSVVQENYYHFPESPTDECLYFFIEDEGGNGICCNGDVGRPSMGTEGRFDLLVNGVTSFSSDGRIAFGERVQFGRQCVGGGVTPATRVSVAINFDSRPEDVSWYIGDSTGKIVIGGVQTGSPNQAQSSSSAIVYDPNQGRAELCYTLTIVDSAGDGICCNSGVGNYTVGLGWDTIAARNGDFGYGERLRFGFQCSQQLEVIAGFGATANVSLDISSSQKSFSLQDASGYTLYSSDSGGVFSSAVEPSAGGTGPSSVTVFHFPEAGDARDECIWFTIEDESGSDFDPFVLDNSYSLSVNGQLVRASQNGIGYGERVQFGTGACAVDVVKATTIRVDLASGFRNGVGDGVDWYIGNETGVEIMPRSAATNLLEVTFAPESIGSLDFCHSFTIVNSAGTGNGGYTAYLGWKVAFSRDGLFGYGERLRFGQTCPTPPIVFQGFQAMVDVTFDRRPNETSWRLEDSTGLTLGGGTGDLYIPIVPNITNTTSNTTMLNATDSLVSTNSTADFVNGTLNSTMGNATNETMSDDDPLLEVPRTRVVETFYYFPESPSEDCLSFFIDDIGGDGICCPAVTRGVNQTTNTTIFFDARDNVTVVPIDDVIQESGYYILYVDGAVVYSSDGLFGIGERVEFGGGSCSQRINPVAFLTVEIGLDSRPEETSWRLSELSSNREVASVAPGYYSGVGNATANITNPIVVLATNQTNFTFGTVAVQERVRVYEDESYRMVVDDTGGDGLCCSYGLGYYRVYFEKANGDNVTLVVDGNGVFAASSSHDFNASIPIVEVPTTTNSTNNNNTLGGMNTTNTTTV